MEAVTTSQPAAVPKRELPAVIRSLLKKRGLVDDATIENFLNPKYDTGLGDPFLMTDMDVAVKRIILAAQHNEKVAVYGDYDIDGIASTTLMLEALQHLGLDPVSYIPDRYDEGYGIHIKALEQLKQQGIDLVISVDCGITSVTEAEWARENGLDLIITDHHDVPAEIPQALAVINPKRPGDDYPFKELSGVGVAFAVARAMQAKTGIPTLGQEKWLLDLVALGTVCDVMPLIGENRVLVKYGLKVLQKTRHVGLVALAQSAGLDLADLKAYHLGFVFGPRMNAAGRLEHANYSLELMVTPDPVDAQALAFQLEELNHQRQLEQERIMREAEAQAQAFSSDPVLVLADPSWSHGVVGIVASKLAEKWQKPTLVVQVLGDSTKGSGRSANGYNLIGGLRNREDLFDRLGGHHFAAGFTLPTANLEELRQSLSDHYQTIEAELPGHSPREADIIIEELTDVDWDFYNALDQLEPFGNGNLQPALRLSKLKIITVAVVGKAGQHLKLKLASNDGTMCEAIGFNLVEKYPALKPGQVVDVTCYVTKNIWNDRVSLQYTIISLQ